MPKGVVSKFARAFREVWNELEAGRKVSTKKLILKLYNKAEKGDVPAIREIMDRVFGKPSQEQYLGGPDGGPTTMRVIISDVSKDGPPSTPVSAKP